MPDRRVLLAWPRARCCAAARRGAAGRAPPAWTFSLRRAGRSSAQQHRSGAGARAAVARARGLGERRRAPSRPARVEVELVLEDDEAGALEDGRSTRASGRCSCQPWSSRSPVGTLTSRRPSPREDAAQLAQSRQARRARRARPRRRRRRCRGRRARASRRRNATSKEPSANGSARTSAMTSAGCARSTATSSAAPRPRRPARYAWLGERVADVEDAPLAVVAREAPGDLERPLVARGRREQLARPAAPSRRSSRARARRAVEQRDALELAALDQLPEQPRPRELAALERARRPRDRGARRQHDGRQRLLRRSPSSAAR